MQSCSPSQFDMTKPDFSISLGFGQVCRTAGQENDDHRRGYASSAFHFNEVCFPFFTPTSRFFAEVLITLQVFLGSKALSEMLS